MPILDDILDTILKAKDPVSGVTSYTNLRSAAETMEGQIFDTGISGRGSGSSSSLDSARMPSGFAPGGSRSLDTPSIIEEFSRVAGIKDSKLRETETAKLQFAVGEYQSAAFSQAQQQAASMLGLPSLQQQVAQSEALDRQHPLWQQNKSDSKETLQLKDQMLQTQQLADQMSQKLVAQDGKLNGILKAADVFLKGSLSSETAGDKQEASKERLASYVREVGKKFGGDPFQLDNAPDEVILANKPLVDAATSHAATGGGAGTGPYTAAEKLQQIARVDDKYVQSGTYKWVQETSSAVYKALSMQPGKIAKISASKEMLGTTLDEELINKAVYEFRGDADNSLLTRLPAVGELKQIPEISKLNIFRYISNADPSANYSMKQLIGLALQDEVYKTSGNARANLAHDIQVIASSVFQRSREVNKAYNLPVQEQLGYRIMPAELVKAAVGAEGLKDRYFDLTNPGDVQILINLTLNNRGMFGGKPFRSELLQLDPLLKQSQATQPPAQRSK